MIRIDLGSPLFRPVVVSSNTGMPITLEPRRPLEARQIALWLRHWKRMNQRGGGRRAVGAMVGEANPIERSWVRLQSDMAGVFE